MVYVQRDAFSGHAESFLANLVPCNNHATVVGLSGELGSGKTTFVQTVGKLLGITEHITSPTFVILKTYKLPSFYNLQPLTYNLLLHIDAYRLESGGEPQVLRWQEYVSNPTNLIFIEWPEHVQDVLPDDMVHLQFSFVDETTRNITVLESRGLSCESRESGRYLGS